MPVCARWIGQGLGVGGVRCGRIDTPCCRPALLESWEAFAHEHRPRSLVGALDLDSGCRHRRRGWLRVSKRIECIGLQCGLGCWRQ